MTTALLWFRRDLGLAAHPELTRATRDFYRVLSRIELDVQAEHGHARAAA
jgi:hypothetical protein